MQLGIESPSKEASKLNLQGTTRQAYVQRPLLPAASMSDSSTEAAAAAMSAEQRQELWQAYLLSGGAPALAPFFSELAIPSDRVQHKS